MVSSRKERARVEEVESLTMPEAAYRKVRDNILENRWPPGFQATEQEVASQLEMSRTPVREALLRLQQEGLVEVVPRHGVRVLPVSPADMKEIYEVLTSLESTAAELAAARRLSSEELRPLEEASDAMDSALKRDDLDAWAQADEAFHAQLLSLSGNRMLKQMVLNTWDRAHRARMVTLRLRAKPVHSTREHRDLLKAIRKGDPEAAREVQRAHRERAGKELLDLLQKLGLQHL
ncbi:GntR family transcriptional regulator [Cupriavidus numazuensis]|uniref:HTH-type transcriptional repressor RspR n=1 Tax=Cupriavidus numazuensis TaxID=221992 RepID=A0ABN7Q2M4_9BURK|nr:GntR family transcriptional regulator [Cupriavidus numazuensis]CAG2154773.1 HTH-type transcriptional repressor RspR [Cupriavidus numazuensis]